MINYRAKLDKLKNKEEDIKKKKLEFQKSILKYLRWQLNYTNKQICNLVEITPNNFSRYYGGKLLFRDTTLYKLIELVEVEDDKQ